MIEVPGRSWGIEAWKPGDERAVLELFRAEFGRERSLAHWTWKFLENPYGGPFISLAWHRERRQLVGNQVLMPIPLCVHGRRVLAGHSLDLVVHHDFRRQGVFEHTGRHAIENLERHGGGAVVAFPNASSYPGFVRSLGWSRILEPTLWRLRLGVRHKLERRLGIAPVAAALDAIYRLVNTRAALAGLVRGDAEREEGRVEHGDRLPDGVDDLWERERGRQPFSLWKDREYLSWRYGRHPEQAFVYHGLLRNSRLEGLAISATIAGISHLCEFLVPDRDERVARRLLSAICAEAAARRVDEVHFLAHDSGWFARVFGGFDSAVAGENVFVGRSLESEALTAEMANPANWSLTYGDGDFV